MGDTHSARVLAALYAAPFYSVARTIAATESPCSNSEQWQDECKRRASGEGDERDAIERRAGATQPRAGACRARIGGARHGAAAPQQNTTHGQQHRGRP